MAIKKEEIAKKEDLQSFTFSIQKQRKTRGDTLGIKKSKGMILPPIKFETLIEDVNSNTYSNRCTKQLVESSVGKGYAEGTSPEVIEIFPIETLTRAVTDFIKTGNFTLEIDRDAESGDPLKSYHAPIQTMRKVINKENPRQVDWVQNYNNKNIKKTLPEWNEYNLEHEDLLRLETGEGEEVEKIKYQNMILHGMNYDSNSEYGLPVWIGGRTKIKTLVEGDDYVLSFFSNDGMPKTILTMIGNATNKDIEADIKELFEGAYADGNGKKGHKGLFVKIPLEYGDLKKIELNKNIVDAEFINREREDKLDVCNSFGVPPILVGFQYQGKQGASNEIENIMIWYREDRIEPIQRYVIGKINEVLPEAKVVFNGFYIPDSADSNEKFAKRFFKKLRAEAELQDED